MKEFCENPYCMNPGAKVIPVSVDVPSDQKRTLCTTCEEAYSWGVQHGSMISPDRKNVAAFLKAGGFLVIGLNTSDPSKDEPYEAWAYQGPLDFEKASPVKFGQGTDVHDAIDALDLQLNPKTGEKRSQDAERPG